MMRMTVTSIKLSDLIFAIIDWSDIIAHDLELECIIFICLFVEVLTLVFDMLSMEIDAKLTVSDSEMAFDIYSH